MKPHLIFSSSVVVYSAFFYFRIFILNNVTGHQLDSTFSHFPALGEIWPVFLFLNTRILSIFTVNYLKKCTTVILHWTLRGRTGIISSQARFHFEIPTLWYQFIGKNIITFVLKQSWMHIPEGFKSIREFFEIFQSDLKLYVDVFVPVSAWKQRITVRKRRV